MYAVLSILCQGRNRTPFPIIVNEFPIEALIALSISLTFRYVIIRLQYPGNHVVDPVRVDVDPPSFVAHRIIHTPQPSETLAFKRIPCQRAGAAISVARSHVHRVCCMTEVPARAEVWIWGDGEAEALGRKALRNGFNAD